MSDNEDEESFHSAEAGEELGERMKDFNEPQTYPSAVPIPSSRDSKSEPGRTSSDRSPRPMSLFAPFIRDSAASSKSRSSTSCSSSGSHNSTVENAVSLPSSSDEMMTSTKNVDTNDDTAGWDADGWDDFDADELVTPRSEMPPPGAGGALVLDVDTPTTERTNVDNEQHAIDKTPHDRIATVEEEEQGWTGWGSIFSVATGSINTLKHTVGEGFSDVLDTVQSGFGVPTPEELARMSLEEKFELARKADDVKEPWPAEDKDDCESATDEIISNSGSDTPGLMGEAGSSGYQSESSTLFASLTKGASASPALSGLLSGVRSTGKTLVTGSMDVLESLGKKTYDVLTVTEDDQGGKRRFILSQERTNLSQLLRERKERAEDEARANEVELEAKSANYAYQFEVFEGIAQLEGLEMISANCARQLADLSPSSGVVEAQMRDLRDEILAAVDTQESFSEENEQDFEPLLKEAIAALKIPYNATKLIRARNDRRRWIDECVAEQESGIIKNPNDLHREAVQSLAEFTARAVEMQHKLAQLLLIANSPCENAAPFIRLVNVLCTEIGVLANQFSVALNTAADDSSNPDAVGPLLTSLFLESANSCQYVRESLRLVTPVVELAILQTDRYS